LQLLFISVTFYLLYDIITGYNYYQLYPTLFHIAIFSPNVYDVKIKKGPQPFNAFI